MDNIDIFLMDNFFLLKEKRFYEFYEKMIFEIKISNIDNLIYAIQSNSIIEGEGLDTYLISDLSKDLKSKCYTYRNVDLHTNIDLSDILMSIKEDKINDQIFKK